MSTANQAGNAPAQAPRGSWIARHKFLTFLGVLLLVFLVGFYFLGWPLVKWRFHAQFIASLDEIKKNPAAIERLGEPITVPLLPMPSGRVYIEGDRGEARFDFSVMGPKNKAQAVSGMRKVNDQWGFTQLELEFPGGEKLNLTGNIKVPDDTPVFNPNAKQPEVKAPDLPVDIQLPEMPAMPKK
jgi:hypothetical protein